MPPRFVVLCRLLAALLLLVAQPARADFMEQLKDTLSISDPQNRFHLRFSGLIDLEAYYLTQPTPGLLYTDDDFLLNPRLTLFLDTQIGSNLYGFAQARIDRGFDPSDNGAQIRLDEYLLRYSFGKSLRISIQAGQFATVVGSWVNRHDSWLNPFINAPLPYENLTAIWDVSAPWDAEVLLEWAHVDGYDTGDYSDKILRNPIIWGPSYATGVSVTASLGKVDLAIEVKNASLASRPEDWTITARGFDAPTYSSRLGLRANEMWNFGVSFSAGPYLLEAAGESLPPGRSTDDYYQFVLAQDVSFAWGHLQVWAEFFQARFEVPGVGNADTFAYYLEAKYKITPQLFGAVRWNQHLYGTIPSSGRDVRWGNDTLRVDGVLGYRFTKNLQAKLQYSLGYQDADLLGWEHVAAAQLTVKF